MQQLAARPALARLQGRRALEQRSAAPSPASPACRRGITWNFLHYLLGGSFLLVGAGLLACRPAAYALLALLALAAAPARVLIWG